MIEKYDEAQNLQAANTTPLQEAAQFFDLCKKENQ